MYFCVPYNCDICLSPGLPEWPFSGQISEIWPRFKLVGLKNFSWPFGLFWPRPKLAGLYKMCLAFWLFFGFFYAEIGAYEGKYCYSIISATHLHNFCDKCHIRRPYSDLRNI